MKTVCFFLPLDISYWIEYLRRKDQPVIRLSGQSWSPKIRQDEERSGPLAWENKNGFLSALAIFFFWIYCSAAILLMGG